MDELSLELEKIEKKFKQLINDFLEIQFEIHILRLKINETK